MVMFSFAASMGGSAGVTSVVETTALRKRRKRRSKHEIIKYRRENNLPLSLSQEKYRKRQNRRARERWRKKKRAERSSRNDSSSWVLLLVKKAVRSVFTRTPAPSNTTAVLHQEPESTQNDEDRVETAPRLPTEQLSCPHLCGDAGEIPALLPREDDDSDDDCSDDESDDDEGDDVAVGDLSVSTCDVANASSSTHSNKEHDDPADWDLPELRGKDPSGKGYMIKQLMDLEKKLLTNCSTAAGHNSGDVKGNDSICSRMDNSFQVFVKTPGGRTTTHPVNQSTTVADLKSHLSSATLTPIDKMRVYYGGKLLIDSLNLAEYGITRESTLEMHDGGLMGGSWGDDECPGSPGIDELVVEISRRGAEISRRDAEMSRQEAVISHQEAVISRQEGEISRQEGEIDRLRASRHRRTATIRNLRQEVESAGVALNESEESRRELEERSSSDTREIATLQESVVAQQEELVSSRNFLSIFSREFRELRESNSSLTANAATLRHTVDYQQGLLSSLGDVRSENDDLLSNLDTARETIDAHRLQIAEMEGVIAASEDTISTLRATTERQVAHIRQNDELVEKLNRDNLKMEEISGGLQLSLTQSQQNLEIVMESNERYEQENANLQERLRSSREEIAQQQTILNDFANQSITEAEHLRAENAILREQQAEQAANVTVQEQLDSANAMVVAEQATNAILREQVAQRDQTIAEKEAEIQRLLLQIQLSRSRDRVDATSVTPAPPRRGDVRDSSLAPSLPSPATATVSSSASASATDSDPPSSTTGSLQTKRASLESDSDNSDSDSSENSVCEPKAKKSKKEDCVEESTSIEETSSEPSSLPLDDSDMDVSNNECDAADMECEARGKCVEQHWIECQNREQGASFDEPGDPEDGPSFAGIAVGGGDDDEGLPPAQGEANDDVEGEVSGDTVSPSPSGAMVSKPSHKYDSVCPRSLKAILGSFGVIEEELLRDCPLLYVVLTTFDSDEIEPAIERASRARAANAQGQSDAVAVQEEDEAIINGENVYTVGSIIDKDKLDNLPQHCAVLGLHAQHSKVMDENPLTEGQSVFVDLIREYSERFQLAERKDVVVQTLYDEFSTNYSFIVLSRVANSPGKYVVKEPHFFKDASLSVNKDTGSIRNMLYGKLRKYHDSLSKNTNSLANLRQGKFNYFEGLLPGCKYELGYDSAEDFIPHFKLSDEGRRNPNAGVDEYDPTLTMLEEMYPRSSPNVPSEEHEENIHLMPIEAAIKHRHLIELILSLHNDYDNRDKWEKIGEELVAVENAIPSQLKELFDVPDLEDRPSRCVGEYLINLIKVLSLQCWMSGYKISECGSKEELASLELDHILKYFRKSHQCSNFCGSDTTSHPNPFGLDDILKRALYETFKCRVVHFMWHPRGNSVPSEDLFQERMRRELVLTYDKQIDKVLGLFKEQRERQSVTFREFCQIKEFALLMMDWLSRGAFLSTEKPKVSYKALAIAPMKLFHVALEDLMKYTEAEYNQLHCTTRVEAITNAISTLMARLSGGCSRHEGRGCRLNRAEMNSGQLQASMDLNHRDPNAKGNVLSDLKKCPVRWHKEGIRGDCENECRCCHKKIDAFQNGGPRPQGYTGD